MSDCTCGAPEDAEPEDHDLDCPEQSMGEEECGHERARPHDVECPDCGCDLALLETEEEG